MKIHLRMVFNCLVSRVSTGVVEKSKLNAGKQNLRNFNNVY